MLLLHSNIYFESRSFKNIFCFCAKFLDASMSQKITYHFYDLVSLGNSSLANISNVFLCLTPYPPAAFP